MYIYINLYFPKNVTESSIDLSEDLDDAGGDHLPSLDGSFASVPARPRVRDLRGLELTVGPWKITVVS